MRSDNSANIPSFSFAIEQEMLSRFVTVLQSGFYREATAGKTVASFLSDLPGFTDDYIINRLQTIFLNGDSVDDLELGFSGTSATLALSAAMPGLAGAIFRRNSPHAALRKNTTVAPINTSGKTVRVKVKLFNVIAIERGPELMMQGLKLRTADLISFLELRPSLIEAINNPIFDGIPIALTDLTNILARQDTIILKVNQ